MLRLRRFGTILPLVMWMGLAVPGASEGTAGPGARLEISLPDSASITTSSEELRKHRSLESLVVPGPPAYPGRTLRFTAIPMKVLLPQKYAATELVVVFECLDGFVASIPAARVLGGSAEDAQAFLAIEDPRDPWPSLKEGAGETAGPFYLIWKPGKRNRPVHEEWPYQITRIVVRPMQEELRAIAPDPRVGPGSPIASGFQIYLRNCSPCHMLNGVGESRMGPDLNVPMNPTEYFKPGVFEKYLRNPDSVVDWENQKMPSFPADVMPDAELRALRSYLEYMASRKSPAASGK